MAVTYDELYRYYHELRHICDEYKAFEREPFMAFCQLMDRAFHMTHKVNLETGEITIPKGFGPGDYEEMYNALQKAAAEMKPLHNPAADKILLWEGDNIPWDGFTKEEFIRISHDGPEFVPHMVPFLQNDGKRHPSVLITGGSYRCHHVEGWQMAEFYHGLGYNAFILNNRHGNGAKVRHTMNRALDLQRAIRHLRYFADDLGVNPEKIFTNGFSMGNRATIDLINTLGYTTMPQKIDCNYVPDAIDACSARLNGYVGVYPATFMYDDHNNYRDFPPTFFVIGNLDWSLWRMMPFMADLAVNNVPVELHMFDGIDHGFGMGEKREGRKSPWTPSIAEWTHLLQLWLARVIGD